MLAPSEVQLSVHHVKLTTLPILLAYLHYAVLYIIFPAWKWEWLVAVFENICRKLLVSPRKRGGRCWNHSIDHCMITELHFYSGTYRRRNFENVRWTFLWRKRKGLVFIRSVYHQTSYETPNASRGYTTLWNLVSCWISELFLLYCYYYSVMYVTVMPVSAYMAFAFVFGYIQIKLIRSLYVSSQSRLCVIHVRAVINSRPCWNVLSYISWLTDGVLRGTCVW